MPYTKEQRRIYDAARKRRHNHRPVFERGQFVAWDGEGINNLDMGTKKRPNPDYGHRYVLLASSTGAHITSEPCGLTPRAILDTYMDEHLRLTAERKKPIHVTYGLSYDANMALRGLDYDTVKLIWTKEEPIEFPAGKKRFCAQYRKRKSLYLQRFRSTKLKWLEDGRGNLVKNVDAMTIWDVQGFFQCPFVSALEEYFSPGELGDVPKKLDELKGMRDVFSYDMLPDIIPYNALENEWLVKLMDRLREHLGAVGLPVRMWHGSGAIASAMIREHGAKEHHEYTPPEHEDAVRCAYFGGRIEIGGIGRLEFPFYHADMNAAYPSFIRHLPSLAGALWLSGEGDSARKNAAMTLRRVTWGFPEGIHWYPLPYRSPFFSICYPPRGEGWFWEHEIDAANAWAERYGGGLHIHETISVVPTNAAKPFDFVNARYEQRKTMERNGDGAAHALKMGMASLYGKMAQQIGGKINDEGILTLPPLFSQAWAGWVTSAVRASLVRAALTMRDDTDLIFFATDGIVSKSPLNVPYGEELGEWSQDHADELIVVQPGVYWTRTGERWENHSRGYMVGELQTPELILAAWRKKERALHIHMRRFLTMGSALVSKELWQEWCEWADTRRSLDLTGASPKRHGRGHRSRSPAKGWVPLAPMLSTHYEYSGDLSHRAPLLWDDGEPEQYDEQGVNLRTVDYELMDAYV